MARNPKPVKIKRHKNSMTASTRSNTAIKKIIVLLVFAALVIGAGFVLGKPLLSLISSSGDGSSSQQTVSSQPEITLPSPAPEPPQQDASSQLPEVLPEALPETGNRVYYYATASALSTDSGVKAVIRDMKAKGATHLVFDAKNQDGYVHYASYNQYASQLADKVQIDIPNLARSLKASGLTPVARIYTFMDKMISTVERSTAVMYLGSDTRWLDTSAALGGKAWANPASQIIQDYILALTDEMLSMGVTEIIYAGFSTPTGYSLDKRDFGATTQQVLAKMQSLIGTLKAKISAKGGYSSWQFEYSSVTSEGAYEQYIVHPYQLGAENMIITAKGGEIDVAAATAELTSNENREGIGEITLWLTDNLNTEETKTLGSYFVS